MLTGLLLTQSVVASTDSTIDTLIMYTINTGESGIHRQPAGTH